MGANDADKLMGKALALVSHGKLGDAEQLFARLCEQDGVNGKAWFMRGAIRFEFGDADRAIEYLDKSIEFDPDNLQAHFTLGQLHLFRGNLDAAIAHICRVVELDAKHGEAWMALGSLYADAGELRQAEQASRTAITLLPGLAEPKINLVNALISLEKRDEALALCNSIEAESPPHAGIWHSLGLAYKALGQIAKAAQCLTRVTTLEPDNAGALCALGEIKAAMDDVPQAASLLSRARELEPANSRIHFELGKVLLPSNSAKHRQLVRQLQANHQYKNTDEARNVARELAIDFRFGDTAVEHALECFFDEYDPSQLYPAEWWTGALRQFGERRQAGDTALRSIYSTVYSWSLPCRQALDAIAAFAGKRVASYGSGAAYWEYLLATHYGIDVACHDMLLRHRFMPIQETAHSEATVKPEDTVFFAWLPAAAADASIEQLLNQIATGQKLVLVGEPPDELDRPRTCGTRRFFNYLQENFESEGILPLPNYAYFTDRVELLVRQ